MITPVTDWILFKPITMEDITYLSQLGLSYKRSPDEYITMFNTQHLKKMGGFIITTTRQVEETVLLLKYGNDLVKVAEYYGEQSQVYYR